MIETLYGPIPASIFEKAAAISLLICDVDGVFSDGRIYMGNQGEEFKLAYTRWLWCEMFNGCRRGNSGDHWTSI